MSHWIYHPEHEAKIVSSAEYPVYLREGWYDTPAKFLEKKDDLRGTFGLAQVEAPKKIRKKKSSQSNEVSHDNPS